MLWTEDDRLTSLLGGIGGGGVVVANMGVVEPVFEKAKEPFDCETAAESGLGLDGRLDSMAENVERRFSHVDCVTEEAQPEVSLFSSPALSSDAMLTLSRECTLRFNVLFLLPESVLACPALGSRETADCRDFCAEWEKVIGEEKEKVLGEAYVSTACKVHVAVEVMSKRGAESLRRREERELREEDGRGRSGSGRDSGLASAKPRADTAAPALEATS